MQIIRGATEIWETLMSLSSECWAEFLIDKGHLQCLPPSQPSCLGSTLINQGNEQGCPFFKSLANFDFLNYGGLMNDLRFLFTHDFKS